MANNLPKTRRFNRLAVTIFWCAVVAAAAITLLSYERIDVLYILATLGLVTLLVIVATADLEAVNKDVQGLE